jgi:hypothetical protein
MRNRLPQMILTAAAVAAFVICQAQVYSVGGSGSFVPASPRPDEIKITSYTYQAADQTSCVEWYVSTNTLAKQPRWDGLSAEAPLSARKACVLALAHVREHFPEVQSWSVKSVNIRNPHPDQGEAYPDVWCYEITLTPRDPQLRARVERQASVAPTMQIVLFDGTVVPPTVLKRK